VSNGSYFWVLMIPFLGIFGVVLVHWLSARWIKDRHWVIIVVVSVVGELWVLFKTGQSTLGSVVVTWFDGLSYMIMNTAIFGGLCYGYFTVVNLNITALRIRLLKIMYGYPEPLVPEAILMKEYHPEAIIDMRVKRLEKMNQIQCDRNGNCVLRRKELACLAGLIQKIRTWLNITPVV
jgi:hypothetical protein